MNRVGKESLLGFFFFHSSALLYFCFLSIVSGDLLRITESVTNSEIEIRFFNVCCCFGSKLKGIRITFLFSMVLCF